MKKHTTYTRRSFLHKTAILGIAAPVVVPARVLGGRGYTGPGDQVGIGYIGVGRRARGLMNLPRAARIVAVCDVDLRKAKAMAKKRNCRAYQDYRKMLEAKDIDAVIISTPDHWHALPSIHACQADKDVYCEKPLSLTIREGRLMVEAARKYDRVFQTGSQQRSMKQNRIACELIRNGRIGKVHTVIGHNYPSPWELKFPGQPLPPELNWDMWCGQTDPVPFHRDIYVSRANPGWISCRTYSGGEMTGWGAHGLDQVQWALGMDDSGPVEVWTEGGKFDPPVYTAPESRSRGNQLCSKPKVCFRYANGVVLRLENGPPGGAIFIGTKGKITISRGRFTVDPPELAEEPLGPGAIRLPVSDDHMLNWIACIKSRKRPVADVEIGHRSCTVCHLGNIARWIGRPLKWDPKKERFVGDPQADSYLDRPKRKPYDMPDRI